MCLIWLNLIKFGYFIGIWRILVDFADFVPFQGICGLSWIFGISWICCFLVVYWFPWIFGFSCGLLFWIADFVDFVLRRVWGWYKTRKSYFWWFWFGWVEWFRLHILGLEYCGVFSLCLCCFVLVLVVFWLRYCVGWGVVYCGFAFVVLLPLVCSYLLILGIWVCWLWVVIGL